MKCDNYLCIYEEKGICLLENISLDIIGQCNECEYVKLDKERLESLKEDQRCEI